MREAGVAAAWRRSDNDEKLESEEG